MASGAPIARKDGRYSLQNAVADLVGILDTLGVDAADIVAHDWGASVAWLTAAAHPNRSQACRSFGATSTCDM